MKTPEQRCRVVTGRSGTGPNDPLARRRGTGKPEASGSPQGEHVELDQPQEVTVPLTLRTRMRRGSRPISAGAMCVNHANRWRKGHRLSKGNTQRCTYKDTL